MIVHVADDGAEKEGSNAIEMDRREAEINSPESVNNTVVVCWPAAGSPMATLADMTERDGMLAKVASTVLFDNALVGVETSVVILTIAAEDRFANWTSTAHTMLGDGVNAETNSRTRWS